jgi:hypothetical protein
MGHDGKQTMSLPGYDAWKLRSPDWDDPPFECEACDDMGCPECCEPVPITLDDLEEIDEAIAKAEVR